MDSYGVENTTTEARSTALPPSVPGSLGCNESDRAELDWIQLGATAPRRPNEGGFRPYGALGVGVYFGSVTPGTDIADRPTARCTPAFPQQQCGPDGRGRQHWRRARLGAEQQTVWSIGLSARLHALTGGDQNGEYGGDTFVTVLAGVGYRW